MAADDDTIDKRNKLLIEIWKQAVDTQNTSMICALNQGNSA
jgi:hypothetical protein